MIKHAEEGVDDAVSEVPERSLVHSVVFDAHYYSLQSPGVEFQIGEYIYAQGFQDLEGSNDVIREPKT